MSQPIVIPPVMTAQEKFDRLMQNPSVRRKAMTDKLFADRLMRMLRVPDNRSQGAQINPASQANYIKPPVGTTLAASPAKIAAKGESVSDQVKRLRDGFLVADGVQVAGDYDTVIRAQKGGIPAPRTSKVGSFAQQSYKYPSQKMVTGAALAGGPTLTKTRGMLPTSQFNPGAFVAARPDSQGNNLITNDPRAMPKERIPKARPHIIENSPSEYRRKNIATLMGLGGMARTGIDPWSVIAASVNSIPTSEKVAQLLVPVIKWLASDTAPDCKAGDWACATAAVSAAVARGLGRVALINTILADKIDFRDPNGRELTLPGMNVTLNQWLTDNMGFFITDPGWKALAQAVGFRFPLDIRLLGLRKVFLVQAYKAVWGTAIKPEWYTAISNEMMNEGSGSLERALVLLANKKYDPDGPAPIVPLRGGLTSWDAGATQYGSYGMPAATGGANKALLVGGGVLAAVLIGAGIWMKRQPA